MKNEEKKGNTFQSCPPMSQNIHTILANTIISEFCLSCNSKTFNRLIIKKLPFSTKIF